VTANQGERMVRREFRLTEEEDRMVRKAADIVGSTVSAYIRFAARQAAGIDLARAGSRRKRRGKQT